MKHFAEAIGIALCVMAMAYCTVQSGNSSNEYSLKRAELCRQDGGRYDFGWTKCNYEEKAE